MRDVHRIGRFDLRDPAGPRFEWPASAFHLRFRGSELAVRLRGQPNDFAVSIDGGPPRVLRFEGEARSVLAAGLPSGEHSAVLHRRTEAMFGAVQLLGFDGELVPSPFPFTRRIEFVGDSITCGYGNEAPNALATFARETENEWLAYGAITARALRAAHTSIAWSGRGVVENHAGDPFPLMPVLWERTLPSDETPWDFGVDAPDVVVFHLGTNDAWQGDPGARFTDGYVAFLARVRAAYPDAKLVVLAATEDVAKRAEPAARAAGAHYLRFAPYDEAWGRGADGHPNIKGNRERARELAPFLADLMGWTVENGEW